jgi:hypothetical protein
MASLFAEEVRYKNELLKRRAKPRPARWLGLRTVEAVEVVGIDAQEVVEEARKLFPELTVTAERIRKWVYAGLLPGPETVRGRGKGKGVAVGYPTDAPAQLATAAFAAARGYKQKEIAQARQLVLEGLRKNCPEHEEAEAALVGKLKLDEISPKARRLVRAGETYAAALARARGGLPLEERWPELRCIDMREVGVEPRFCFYICLPGAWWDRRISEGARAALEKQVQTVSVAVGPVGPAKATARAPVPEIEP